MARPSTVLLWLLLLLTSASTAQTRWVAAHDLRVEGQAFSEVAAPFDRLPAEARTVVRDRVWKLSEDSAGICVRFTTDATTIHCRWGLRKAQLAMPHMPATGVSGVDLYVDGEDSGAGPPARVPMRRRTRRRLDGIDPGEREYMLYLPLYNGVTHLEVGVPEAASSSRGRAPRGADAASRLLRHVDHPRRLCVPLGHVPHGPAGSLVRSACDQPGFLGERPHGDRGRPVRGADRRGRLRDRLPAQHERWTGGRAHRALVRQLRERHPKTPILLVEDRTFANAFLLSSRRRHHEASREALRAGYERLVEAGVPGLVYVEGADLLGNEDTVDASHPTDLGFERQARTLASALEGPLGPWRR